MFDAGTNQNQGCPLNQNQMKVPRASP